MKKRFLSLLLALLLLTLLLPAAFAEGGTQGIIVLPPEETPAQEAGAPEESALPPEETPAQEFLYVLDDAGLLSESQREALEQKAAALFFMRTASPTTAYVDETLKIFNALK